jgi:hypothetical protein
MSPYEQKAIQALSTPQPSVATVLRGIGWAVLSLGEALLILAAAFRPEEVEVVELTHDSQAGRKEVK